MQVSFKQRTIDNKIKVYDQLITQWVKMRNFIVANQYLAGQQQIPANVRSEFDLLYSQGLTYIGEAYLICGDVTLAKDLDDLNEKLYRTQRLQMTIQGINGALDQLKVDAVALLVRMEAPGCLLETSTLCSQVEKESVGGVGGPKNWILFRNSEPLRLAAYSFDTTPPTSRSRIPASSQA